MATVMRLMLEDDDPRFEIRAVATYVDASRTRWLWTWISGVLKATFLILAGRVDLLHVHFSHRSSVARKFLPLFVARLRGVPTVVHSHSSFLYRWMDSLPPQVQGAVRFALRADYCIVLGNSLAEKACRYLDFNQDQIRVLYNPVVLPAEVADRTGRPVRMVYLGRMGPKKGTRELIIAVGMLSDDVRSQLAITLAGDGEVDDFRQLVSSCNLDHTITILDWVDPPTRDQMLAESSVFLLPSHSEGLPMAMLEAMAYGLVPVTTPVGAITEVVTDGQNGLLVPVRDPERLAQVLAAVVVDDELRARLSAAARLRASAFDIGSWRVSLRQLWISAVEQRLG